MKRISYFQAILAAAILLAGCNQEVESPQDEPLNGAFSVSPTQKVRFSRGNLQYTQSTNTWSFAEHQYDFVGADNVSGSNAMEENGEYVEGTDLADKIDLFSWSSSAATEKWGITMSTEPDNYGAFLDWGQNIGDGTTWRTLKIDEWYYLLTSRPNASDLMGIAHINLNKDGSEYANGLILLPDDWQIPDNLTFKSGFSNEDNFETYSEYQTLTFEQWQLLETTGAVFLPASGYRSGSAVIGIDGLGSYWSATSGDYSSEVHYLCFMQNGLYWGEYYWFFGYSVRLVQDL